MKPEDFNKIVDIAVSSTRDADESRTRHQDTVNNVLLGRISKLEADVGYLRGGTAWNDIAQKMLSFERRLKEIELKECAHDPEKYLSESGMYTIKKCKKCGKIKNELTGGFQEWK